MAKLPRATGEQVKKALEKAGFVKVGQKGSHLKLKHSDGYPVIVPMHGSKTIKAGTLKSILRQARLTADQLTQLLER